MFVCPYKHTDFQPFGWLRRKNHSHLQIGGVVLCMFYLRFSSVWYTEFSVAVSLLWFSLRLRLCSSMQQRLFTSIISELYSLSVSGAMEFEYGQFNAVLYPCDLKIFSMVCIVSTFGLVWSSLKPIQISTSLHTSLGNEWQSITMVESFIASVRRL